MKAIVKVTGEIVDIYEQTLLTAFDSNDVRLDEVEFLEGDTNFTPDYWTRLEHQYAGMAMQGILANIDLLMSLANKKTADYPAKYTVAEFAKDCAHALVEKLKEEK